MTTPALPSVQLGTPATDIGQGLNTFIQGLLGQRQRTAQLALQQALGQAGIQRQGAETGLIGAQTGETGAREGLTDAQTQQLLYGLQPAGHDQFLQLQSVDANAKPEELQGMNRAAAQTYINDRMMRMLMLQGKVMPVTSPSGQMGYMQPFAPGGPAVTMIPGAGKPVSEQQTRQAGLALAAESADNDLTRLESQHPEIIPQVATALTGPSLMRLAPFIGQGMEEALTQLRFVGVSDPNAQEYIKRLYDYASLVAPDRYGRQFRNPAILHQAWTDFGSGQFGLDPQGILASQRNRHNGTATLKSAAGPQALQQSQQYFQPSQPGIQSPAVPPAGTTPGAQPFSQYDRP